MTYNLAPTGKHKHRYSPDQRHRTAEHAMSDHEHEWGPMEFPWFTGEPHRKCQVDGCRWISLDFDDEPNDEEE